MNTEEPFRAAVAILEAEIKGVWDADYVMPDDYVLGTPLGRAVKLIHDADPVALQWLCFFVARRALACWEMSCSETHPRDMVGLIARHLHARDVNLDEACKPIQSPRKDCLYETQPAANSVYHAARYLRDGSLFDAFWSISGADIAYDHVLTEDGFRPWLTKIAIPVAREHREMSLEERLAYRTTAFGIEATRGEPIVHETA